MIFDYTGVREEVSNEDKRRIEKFILDTLTLYFDMNTGYLQFLKMEEKDFFDDDVAAMVESKDKVIHLNYRSFYELTDETTEHEQEDYDSVINTLLHEYIHMINHYSDLKEIKEYIAKMDTYGYVKCTIDNLIDEYIATYRSGKLVFAKNEINKVLPSMCRYMTQYRGKTDCTLYWIVVKTLGIGMAQDILLFEQGHESQFICDVEKEEVLPYKELILKIRSLLMNFDVINYVDTITELKNCAISLCDIFGLDENYLRLIDGK